MPFADVQPQLAARGMGSIDAPFWEAIKANLTTIDDARDWWDILSQPITPVIEDKEFANTAASLLPAGDWNEGSWDTLVNAVKETTGRKGKELFMPLRLALTGREHGPEMKTVFALLGRDRAEKRLKGEAA
jgi:glutamyl-tRNA synthetase